MELAILLPFLAFLFAVAVDFSRIFYATQIVESCAYAGALYASQTASSGSSPQTAAQDAAVAEGTNLSPPLKENQVTCTSPDANNNITVTVRYTFHSITNLPGIPSKVRISYTVTMVVAPQ